MKLFLLPALLILLSGCEMLIHSEDKASRDPQTNFEYLWREVDQKYSYFDVKDIDWDDVYNRYDRRIQPRMNDLDLFDVLGDMLTELRDDHANLITGFNVSFFGVDNLGPDNFDWRIITDNYLPGDYFISGPFVHDFIRNTDNRVGYIRFSSFTGNVGGNLSFALSRFSNTDGIILDIRENGGGVVLDVYRLLSRFVDEETLVLYSRIKNGPGRNDFSEPEPAYVQPAPGTRYLRPVVVLTDRGTYSSGSFTALAVKAIPNMILMGDTTGGGLGLPNGGQLPNGWTYRFSVSQALDLQMNNEYENGVPPDIVQYMDLTDRSRDEVIDRAVDYILNN
jgi:C-terminal processing protease CtpA/Prc